MARIEFKGMDAYMQKLEELEVQAEPILRSAVFVGVGIGADAVRSAIEAIPSGKTRPGPDGVADYEKQAMLAGLGTTPIENDAGFVNGKIGFAGYFMHNDRKLPIPMIARAVNSGTSFTNKNTAIKDATRAMKLKVIAEMDRTVHNEIEKIIK